MTHLKSKLAALCERYKHLWILSYFPIYLMWFAYVEDTVTTHFHVIHVALDDYIPFCEYFVIPYFLWFAYVAWGVAYFALNNRTEFYKLCGFLFTGMTIFLICSTLYPNGHYLRPYYFSHHNFCTMLLDLLYSMDTATNLFPSIHVYNSIGIHLAVMQSVEFKNRKTVRILSGILMVSIVLSTMLIKQHSVFDVVTAIALSWLMYRVIYRKKWKRPVRTSAARGKEKIRQT